MSIGRASLTSDPILKDIGFRNFILGQFISLIGDSFYLIALPLLALELSNGSGTALGITLMLTGIPRAALMLVGGALVDRFSSKHILILTNWANAICISVLVILIVSETAQIWHLYIVAFLMGFVDAFFYPASRSIVPMIVRESQFASANAYSQVAQRIVLFVGPGVAGLVVGSVGIVVALVLDIGSFLVANIFFTMMPIQNNSIAEHSSESVFSAIKSGIQYVFRDKALLSVMLLIASVDFAFTGCLDVGLPVLLQDKYGNGANALGVSLSLFGAGSLIGIVISKYIPAHRLGYVFSVLMLLFSLGLLLIGITDYMLLVLFAIFMVGICSGIFNVLGISWIQQKSPSNMIGRVMSIVLFSSLGLNPLSNAIAGVLAEIDVASVFIVAGIFTFIATVLLVFQPKFREIAMVTER